MDGDISASGPRCCEEYPPNSQLNGVVEGPASSVQQSRRPRLPSLQIPERSVETPTSAATPSSNRAGLPPRPNSARFTTASMRNLLPQKSFWTKDVMQDVERTVLIVPETPPSADPARKPSASKSFFLSKIFFSPNSSKGGCSLPVTPMVNSHSVSAKEKPAESLNSSKTEVMQHMTRSFSVPSDIKSRSLKRTASNGLIRVILSTPRSEAEGRGLQGDTSTEECAEISLMNEDAGEDIPEEDAVCRICMVELGIGGETLKMECSCKGDLSLAHQECALKWFSIKGNKICDICNQEVRNLPVMLLKITDPGTAIRQAPTGLQHREIVRYRVWQDVPILVLISMLAYFCFLEQLLVSEMGPRALAVSLPFSCVLGLVSSLIASTMVIRNYIWAYACFQFASVVLFTHIFYTTLNVNEILSIVLSSFAGFGITIIANSLITECIRWRRSRQTRSANLSTSQDPRQG